MITDQWLQFCRQHSSALDERQGTSCSYEMPKAESNLRMTVAWRFAIIAVVIFPHRTQLESWMCGLHLGHQVRQLACNHLLGSYRSSSRPAIHWGSFDFPRLLLACSTRESVTVWLRSPGATAHSALREALWARYGWSEGAYANLLRLTYRGQSPMKSSA